MRDAPARLPFAWWNTKLAPPSRVCTATQDHRGAVREVIGTLVGQQGCLVVALAEVRRESVLQWVPVNVRANWDEVTDVSGHPHDFDVAIAFDQTRLELIEHHWALGHHAGQRVRAGLVATFGLVDDSGWLIVAAAHWRSDMLDAADARARRAKSAEILREKIAASVRRVDDPTTPVLILGDFNAEPFEEPFHAGLPTARSRFEVQRHRPRSDADILFYNASWRWLGERYPWSHEQREPTLAGTYRREGGTVPTSWRTFDQVLVSGSLLGGATWSLDERALGIFDDACAFDRERSRPCNPFDHLPIVGHLERPALSAT